RPRSRPSLGSAQGIRSPTPTTRPAASAPRGGGSRPSSNRTRRTRAAGSRSRKTPSSSRRAGRGRCPRAVPTSWRPVPAERRARRLVVTGQYDSTPRPRAGAQAGAPGANEDVSGTAAVLELARVMSRYKFDATLVFLAVAGEEQGLLGSRHWAGNAKKEGRK